MLIKINANERYIIKKIDIYIKVVSFFKIRWKNKKNANKWHDIIKDLLVIKLDVNGEGGDSLKVLVREKCKRKSSNKSIKKNEKKIGKIFVKFKKKGKGKVTWSYIYNTISICVFRSRSVSQLNCSSFFL